MQKRSLIAAVFVLCAGVSLHVLSRHYMSVYSATAHLTSQAPSAFLVQSVAAGPAPGLAADYNIVAFSTLFYEVSSRQLSQQEKMRAYEYLFNYIDQAQRFDPWFWDVYRLAIGITGFVPEYTRKVILLTERGAHHRNWDWEPPFLAGFLAHNLLNDDRLAVRLLQLSATRPGAPPLALGLAAKFLAGEKGGKQEGIAFLEYMRRLLPKEYHDYIEQRIARLKSQNLEEH